MAEGPSYFSAEQVIDMMDAEVEEEEQDDIDEPMCEGSDDDLGVNFRSNEEDR